MTKEFLQKLGLEKNFITMPSFGESSGKAIMLKDLLEIYKEQLLIQHVSQQRELLEWLSDEDYFNIPKDEISEILEDWQTYNSNCG